MHLQGEHNHCFVKSWNQWFISWDFFAGDDDGDGIPDHLDDDDDNDGVPDAKDNDDDGDGIPDEDEGSSDEKLFTV